MSETEGSSDVRESKNGVVSELGYKKANIATNAINIIIKTIRLL